MNETQRAEAFTQWVAALPRDLEPGLAQEHVATAFFTALENGWDLDLLTGTAVTLVAQGAGIGLIVDRLRGMAYTKPVPRTGVTTTLTVIGPVPECANCGKPHRRGYVPESCAECGEPLTLRVGPERSTSGSPEENKERVELMRFIRENKVAGSEAVILMRNLSNEQAERRAT